MNANVEQIVWAIEEKIMSRYNNKNFGVRLFRDQECKRDDYRLPIMVEETFDILIKAFMKEKGRTNLTKTLILVGEMVARRFDIEASKSTAIQLGIIIIDPMITYGFLILMQEPFFTEEEILVKGLKKTVRSQGYILEIGPEFQDIDFVEKARSGIRLHKYPVWKSSTRLVDGVHHELAKYYGDKPEVIGDEDYLKAVNNLEQVKWEINPNVTKVSNLLAENIVNTTIMLDQDTKFDVTDVKREKANKHLAKQKLYLNGTLFDPIKGNKSTVTKIEKALNKLNTRINGLAEGGIMQLKEIKKYKKWSLKYEKESNFWQARLLCLATQSKTARDAKILSTIKDWGGYQFYLGMFLDFRGRMYAKDPFFSYQSSDLARGHLMFAEKKLMTDIGYQHLLLHIANSYNQTYTVSELSDIDWMELNYIPDLEADGFKTLDVDKMSLEDRRRWADENLDLFTRITEDPIANNEWMDADKPWVFLSLCFEVVNYWEALGSGKEYHSQIPIAIDGSSNGTQHLAAMSLDEEAGKMVGLVPMDKPIDFYIEVAKGILGRNIGTDLGKLLAKIEMKYIRKGITKRGTMTRAYDAGVSCIAEIIYTDCYMAKMTNKYGITKNIAFALAKELVEVYNTLCTGPVEIKDYLQAITKHQLESEHVITWTTPTGFPVVSESWLWNKGKIQVYIQGKKCGLIVREQVFIAMKNKIISGISPNFVHSMDASHMAMVINRLHDQGITSFGAIHDSYSVHAEDVGELLDVTKETFIDMYSNNMLRYMKEQITNADPSFAIEPPKLGDLVLSGIRDSDYFFC